MSGTKSLPLTLVTMEGFMIEKYHFTLFTSGTGQQSFMCLCNISFVKKDVSHFLQLGSAASCVSERGLYSKTFTLQ